MKKFVIAICSLILILLLLLITVVLINKSKEEKYHSQIEEKFSKIEEVKYDQILSKEGDQLYYYYQPNCGYCNKLKPSIVEFNDKLNDSINLSLNKIDMSLEENSNAWYDWDKHHEQYGESSDNPQDNPNYKFTPDKLLTVDDVKITGTPTILYVKDKKIEAFKIGNDDILALLSDISKENGIDFKPVAS